MSNNYKIDLYSTDIQYFNLRNPYRFCFKGQACPPFWRKKDDEVAGTGNTNKTMFWENDKRLGRRWNIDQYIKPWISFYHAFSNKPTYKIDSSFDNDTKYYDKKANKLNTNIDDNQKKGYPVLARVYYVREDGSVGNRNILTVNFITIVGRGNDINDNFYIYWDGLGSTNNTIYNHLYFKNNELKGSKNKVTEVRINRKTYEF